METIPIPVPVEADFWNALSSNDLGTAQFLVGEAIKGDRYSDKGINVYRNSILHDHLWKYVTGFRTTHDPDSVTVECVEIEDDQSKGSLSVTYHVSAYLGCSDIDINEDQDAVIDFTIDSEKRIVTALVLEDSQRESQDAEWAE